MRSNSHMAWGAMLFWLGMPWAMAEPPELDPRLQALDQVYETQLGRHEYASQQRRHQIRDLWASILAIERGQRSQRTPLGYVSHCHEGYQGGLEAGKLAAIREGEAAFSEEALLGLATMKADAEHRFHVAVFDDTTWQRAGTLTGYTPDKEAAHHLDVAIFAENGQGVAAVTLQRIGPGLYVGSYQPDQLASGGLSFKAVYQDWQGGEARELVTCRDIPFN